VIRWSSEALETAVVENGGCAAAMRSAAAWATHPQGRAVSQEPLVHQLGGGASGRPVAPISPARPLAGIRVLDLTRVLAGPVATRFLAGYGAEVLRIDPLDWDEPGVLPDVTLGKRRARLDLRSREGRDVFAVLLAGADLLIHGYRADALERLGLGTDRRQAIRPGLIDVSLDAYGWTGPWAQRRGFDSLVQMSAGFAEAGMRHYRTDRPKPLPVQALDHATGYILAAAALRGLNRRAATGEGSVWRTSLARVAGLLATMPAAVDDAPLAPVSEGHYQPELEQTAWGPLSRLRPPLEITGADMRWDRPAGPLGSDAPRWM
jgi:crotonobetainyl-CoA:carnitine CoA-transferase CaiB-like acyl-CoA transferase